MRLRLPVMLPTQLPTTQEKPGAEGTGVEIWVSCSWRSHSSPTQNEQRATMQTPQGLDATHDGELFPIDESRRTPTRMGLGLFVWDVRASPERSAGRLLVRQGVDALRPRCDAANPASLQLGKNPGPRRRG